MRSKGKITTWNDEKRFGYITPASGDKPIFVHISAFSNRNRRPELNQRVTYAATTDKQGRPCAINVTLAGDRLSQMPKLTTGSLPVMT
ncbi:MAG: cold shock domain-containing protein, partial [Gammaproteobacteria bacterium]|nr:cold shock domain-containing protein [Gammaproteobacteria bacterium]